MIEREKRYNLKTLPTDIHQIISKTKIEQIYTNTNPKNSPSSRIRKSYTEEYTDYSHCTKYKLDSNFVEEIEFPLTINQYERISEFVNKKPIKKERWVVKIYEECFAEIDFYEDGKIMIEVEFDNDEKMNGFIPPSWFGEEIKDKKSYSYEKFCEMNKGGLW